MAYVYLPPRVENYFPSGPPYLSGLGDYTADMNAYRLAALHYRQAVAAYPALKAKYDAAMVDYAAAVKQLQAGYDAAGVAWSKQFAAIRDANTTKSAAIAKSYGLSLPNSYYLSGACLTQEQHNAYAQKCSTTVKGLGSSDPDCGYKLLPVCAFPAHPGSPTYPKQPVAPAVPVAPTMPTAPAVTTPVVTTPVVTTKPTTAPIAVPVVIPQTPQQVDEPVTTDLTPVAQEPKQAGMLSNGLLLVALGIGGYLIYRTVKKPKAAA